MTKKEKQQREFAAQLTRKIASTFRQAFRLSFYGVSEDALLIDFDIQAAAGEIDHSLIVCGRNTIRAAVRAVSQGIPYPLAYAYLISQCEDQIEQQMSQQFTRKRKQHAVDKNTAQK